MKVLFVGDSWQGSTARSTREAIAAMPDVSLDDIGEDHYFPAGRSLVVRGASRLLRPWHSRELERTVSSLIEARRPDVLMVYKGAGVPAAMIRRVKAAGVFTVNVFPDYSPHAYGARLKEAMGEYDLVVSTKPFHPAAWRSIYGYANNCVCVPHGYDPAVHLWEEPPVSAEQDFDIVMAATWRRQYHLLMLELAQSLAGESVRVGIIGSGWDHQRSQFPSQWQLATSIHGRAYGDWLRRGKIVIAPVHRDVVIAGQRQPGDEDTIRTYELAAMGCFFLHPRTPFAQTIYDERTEVPMWDDAEELARLIRRFLPLEGERREMARRAHTRAVPEYSFASRARQILEHVKAALNSPGHHAL